MPSPRACVCICMRERGSSSASFPPPIRASPPELKGLVGSITLHLRGKGIGAKERDNTKSWAFRPFAPSTSSYLAMLCFAEKADQGASSSHAAKKEEAE